MYALRAVHELRDRQIRRERNKNVCVLSREPVLLDQEGDHLSGGHPSGFVQIRMEAHGDEMGRRLGARPHE